MDINITLRRVLAFSIDILIVEAFSAALHQFLDTRFLLVYLIALFTYFLFFEYYFGKSFGKKLLKIEVVFITKSLKNVAIRTASRFIPFDLISFIFNDSNLASHDLLSNSKVIKS